jgi:ribonuclease HII
MEQLSLFEIIRPQLVAGVDEAGRGPLAGPVVAAAVILDPSQPIEGLDDSKKLSAGKRQQLAIEIRARSLAFSVAFVSAQRIDEINILQASLEAMRLAVLELPIAPQLCLIDGNQLPHAMPCAAQAVVQGDALEACISAASILAKTERDAWMLGWHASEPQYGFDRHFGYPTPAHLAALRKHGVGLQHRRSFRPVAGLMAQ